MLLSFVTSLQDDTKDSSNMCDVFFVNILQGWVYKHTTNMRDALMMHDDRLMFSL